MGFFHRVASSWEYAMPSERDAIKELLTRFVSTPLFTIIRTTPVYTGVALTLKFHNGDIQTWEITQSDQLYELK